MCASDVTVPANQDRETLDEEVPTFLKKVKLESAQERGPDTGPTVYQGRGAGTRGNWRSGRGF